MRTWASSSRAAGLQVFGEWRLHKGRGAKENQAHPVALTTRQEIVHDLLHSGQTINGLVKERHHQADPCLLVRWQQSAEQ
jgi:hypothetical protein